MIESVIGEGGMGIVYLAQQQYPKRKVAVKRLKNRQSGLDKALYREAMITGSLDHPTIIPVHALNLTQYNGPEVVMKRVQGTTMLSQIEGSKISEEYLRKMSSVLGQICQGLEYAHRKGIFHRDIKPENIMIGEFGEVYLLDWGIAVEKLSASKLPKGLVGTLAYMAPEMLSGDSVDVDARTDVYLLGATLHHILTGEPRHLGDENSDIITSIRNSGPYEYDESLPEILVNLANQACHQDPDKRPQSPLLFLEVLQNYSEYSQAYGLCTAAQEEFETLIELIKQRQASQDQRLSILLHYNRSRFGIEQALDIWPEFSEAKQLLQQTIATMADYYLSNQQLQAAQPLLLELDDIPDHLQNELDAQLSKKLALEDELTKLRKNLPTESSKVFRVVFAIALLGVSLIFLYNLLQIDDLDPNTISQETLFFHAVAMSLPLIPVLLIGKNKLLASANARQAAIAVAGTLLVVLLHRWISLSYQETPASIIVIDLFIFGLGMMNAEPAIKYGKLLGVLIIGVGLTNHYFPITFWPGSLLVAIAFVLCLLGDWKRNWNIE